MSNDEIQPVLPRPNIDVGPKGFEITNFDQAWRLASAVARSQFRPKGMEKPEDILIAIQMGYEIGFTPIKSLQSIAVINGRPGIFGDAALSLVRASGVLEHYEQELQGEAEERYAIVTSKRKGMPPLSTKFSVADAKKANLWNKGGPWTQYPDRMLIFRARGFNLRDNFGDILGGFKTTEELADYPAEPRVLVETAHGPQRQNDQRSVAPIATTANGTDVDSEGIRDVRAEHEQAGGRIKRPRGRPRKIDNPQLSGEVAREGDSALEAEVAEEPAESSSPAAPAAVLIIERIRAALEKSGKSEARLLAVMNDWKYLPDPSAGLADVELGTLDMIEKRWDAVAKHL